MGEKENCMEHSGCEARITQLEKNDIDIFGRLHNAEETLWKAAGASGLVCGIITSLVVAVILKLAQ